MLSSLIASVLDTSSAQLTIARAQTQAVRFCRAVDAGVSMQWCAVVASNEGPVTVRCGSYAVVSGPVVQIAA